MKYTEISKRISLMSQNSEVEMGRPAARYYPADPPEQIDAAELDEAPKVGVTNRLTALANAISRRTATVERER